MVKQSCCSRIGWWRCGISVIVMFLQLLRSFWGSFCRCCCYYCCCPSSSSTVIRSRQGNPSVEIFRKFQLRCMILVQRERERELFACVLVCVCSCECFMRSSSTCILACTSDRIIIMHHTTIMCFIKTSLSLSVCLSFLPFSLCLSRLWMRVYVFDSKTFLFFTYVWVYASFSISCL